ncbi:MAG: peptidase [Sphingomonas bacterium]|nr:peptidase [Sphingomonas bacterium]
MRRFFARLIALPACAATLASASAPPASDPDTQAWWKITASLSDDAMEGRDTGSAGYDRAARVVAAKFRAAGLTPLGEKGGWFQRVSMNETDVARADVNVGGRPLKFLHDFTVSAAPALPGITWGNRGSESPEG